VGELPSMDEILQEGRKRQRRGDLVLGSIALAGGLVVWLAVYSTFGSELRWLRVMPWAAVVFGVSRIVRALR
jgi:hypothetical protein